MIERMWVFVVGSANLAGHDRLCKLVFVWITSTRVCNSRQDLFLVAAMMTGLACGRCRLVGNGCKVLVSSRRPCPLELNHTLCVVVAWALCSSILCSAIYLRGACRGVTSCFARFHFIDRIRSVLQDYSQKGVRERIH